MNNRDLQEDQQQDREMVKFSEPHKRARAFAHTHKHTHTETHTHTQKHTHTHIYIYIYSNQLLGENNPYSLN